MARGGRSAIVRAVRLDSHRLIEEFMILANVAAAEELEARRQACMYRVHDAPDPDKVEALRDFLDETGIPGLALAKGQVIRPELFNRVLRRAAGTAEAVLVNDLVLRCQAQAVYSPNNIGHFGLALRALRPFHLADPPLCRPPGASGAARQMRKRTPAVTSSDAIAEHISRQPSGVPPRRARRPRPLPRDPSRRIGRHASSPPTSAGSRASGCS